MGMKILIEQIFSRSRKRVTLAKKQCRLDIRKFKFSQRTVNEWNILSGDCVDASSVNMFKTKIDIYTKEGRGAFI